MYTIKRGNSSKDIDMGASFFTPKQQVHSPTATNTDHSVDPQVGFRKERLFTRKGAKFEQPWMWVFQFLR